MAEEIFSVLNGLKSLPLPPRYPLAACRTNTISVKIFDQDQDEDQVEGGDEAEEEDKEKDSKGIALACSWWQRHLSRSQTTIRNKALCLMPTKSQDYELQYT